MGSYFKNVQPTQHTNHTMAALLTLSPSALEETFNLYDIDHSNSLEPNEIENLANSQSISFSQIEIVKMIKERYGEDADSISKDQFIELVTTAFEEHNETVMSFRYFDKNNDGEITYKELKTGIKQLVKEKKIEKISRSDLKKMFKDADKDNNKRISFEEFVNILNNEL